jgi:pimeloyl-ACP methyl ester carboxylesterase
MRTGLADVVESDQLAATDEVREFMVAAMLDGASPGIWGWHDDIVAVVRPWGVELESTRAPVTIWHGADDWLCPPAHARWLAQAIPNARLHLLEGEGHISVPVGHFAEILDELLDLGGSTAPGRGGADGGRAAG